MASDMLNQMVCGEDDDKPFVMEYLVRPRTRPCPPDMLNGDVQVATSACLRCGKVCKGDVVMTEAQEVGEVLEFVACSSDDSIWLLLHMWHRLSPIAFSCAKPSLRALPANSVWGALAYRRSGDSVRVVLPRQTAIFA